MDKCGYLFNFSILYPEYDSTINKYKAEMTIFIYTIDRLVTMLLWNDCSHWNMRDESERRKAKLY